MTSYPKQLSFLYRSWIENEYYYRLGTVLWLGGTSVVAVASPSSTYGLNGLGKGDDQQFSVISLFTVQELMTNNSK